jgi:hypothetical protein
MGAASQGNYSLARSFASEHRALLLGIALPAVVVLCGLAAFALAARAATFSVFLSRTVLPLNLQWYLFSRMWVRAVLSAQRAMATASEDEKSSK